MKQLFLCILLASVAGCASVEVTPITEINKNMHGLRIYAPKPLLIVSSSGAKIEYVPNYNKEYAVNFNAFLANNHSNAKIAGGMIKEVDANLSTTNIINLLNQYFGQFYPDLKAGWRHSVMGRCCQPR